ncbi:MAG: hypothetical protein ABIR03_00440 [Ginsengibacter sp.]
MNTGTHYANSFSANFSDNISLLQKSVGDHPESAFARFMLLNYYNKNNDLQFESLAKQTALYFNNPYWLRFQLSQTESTKEDYSFEQQPIGSLEETIADESEESKMEMGTMNETLSENNEVFQNSEDTIEVKEEEENAEEINQLELKENYDSPDVETESQVDSVKAETETETDEKETENAIPSEIKETNEAHEVETESLDDIANIETGHDINEEKKVEEENETSNLISGISAPATSMELPAFEPLHTVDYFASQGIKIKEEALMNDKLCKQMKSFTDWLKSMKKLHPGKLPEQNEVIEKIIQTAAEESNADAHVLTEAMAEVLLKQNKKEKAVAMYQKLSLMNPYKSAYFAAKIESIKNQ